MECSGFHTGTCEPSVGFPPKQSTMGSEVHQHPATPSGKCPGSLEAAQEKLKHSLPELEHHEQWEAHCLLTFYILLWTTPIAIFLIFNFFLSLTSTSETDIKHLPLRTYSSGILSISLHKRNYVLQIKSKPLLAD